MPDPARVVGRSVGALGRMGYTDIQALDIVCHAAQSAWITLGGDDEPVWDWLKAIAQIAYQRLRLLDPSNSEQ